MYEPGDFSFISDDILRVNLKNVYCKLEKHDLWNSLNTNPNNICNYDVTKIYEIIHSVDNDIFMNVLFHLTYINTYGLKEYINSFEFNK